MAYQVASHARKALAFMDEQGVEAWIIHAMDLYDKSGLYTHMYGAVNDTVIDDVAKLSLRVSHIYQRLAS